VDSPAANTSPEEKKISMHVGGTPGYIGESLKQYALSQDRLPNLSLGSRKGGVTCTQKERKQKDPKDRRA